ncbi:putative nucleoside triphosphatase I [Yalta virus]|nr:putative nucleoside triphosphatase I [Yalta virus]
MASAIIPCVVCYEEEENFLRCEKCSNGTCLECLSSYKKIECPSCLTEYSDISFKDYYEDYKDLYINFYIYKVSPYNDSSNQTIINYFREVELKKNIFWGEKLNIVGTSSLSCRKCFKIVNSLGICIGCKNRICLTCEEDYHEGKPCSRDSLTNIKNIRETCKKCPCCYAYIYKIEGCPHMNCSYCGASFDWNNPHIIQKDKYLYKQLDNVFINEELHNMYKEKYEKMYNKSDLQKKTTRNNYLAYAPENVIKFVVYLKKEITKINRQATKLTVDYFTYVKDKLQENQGKELTQIQINDILDYNFKNKYFITLKKKEYYNKLFSYISNNDYNDVDIIKDILNNIHINYIIPENIKFFFEKSISEFVNAKINNLTKKVKKEYMFSTNDDNSKTIVLLNEEQEIHANEIKLILDQFRVCLNTSHAGSGKTYTSLYVAAQLNIKRIILFCPKIMETKWLNVIKQYNNTYKFKIILFTYSEISSINFTTNNNVYRTVMNGSKICINLTSDFENRINENTMIIFDEIHNIKSPSSKSFKFISVLSEKAREKKAYILSLSATPIEKKEEIKQLTRKVSLIRKYENVPIEEDKYIGFYKLRNVGTTSLFSNYVVQYNLFLGNTLDKNYRDGIGNFETIFNYINKNMTKTYTKLTEALNRQSFRKHKQDLITIIKNCIDSNLDFATFIKNIAPEKEHILGRANKKIRDFIDAQDSVENYITLLFRYTALLEFGKNDKIKLTNYFLLAFLLCLYGADPVNALGFVSYYDSKKIIHDIKNAFFGLRTFNIAGYLKQGKLISLPNAKMLDISLTNDDQLLLDSAFRQVIIEIDNEASLTTLETFALITKGLTISEIVYISYITKIVANIIDQNIKIVIGVHFKETVLRFRKKFAELGINLLVIDGSVKDKQKIIDTFQNDKRYKLLVTNVGCMNTGVDLDDKIGNQPRVVFIIPNFKFSETIQFMYRFKRLNSKSEPHIFLINNHMRIVNILLKKNKINQEIKTSMVDLEIMPKICDDEILDIIDF